MILSAEERLNQKVLQRKGVSNATLQITDRCNYECTHCYQDHTVKNELSTAQWREVIEQLADFGVLYLTFMGGEVFMRRDANELIGYAHELGFSLRVKTTGHHVHDRRADFLATLKPITIDMSLYGHTADVHQVITQHAGSFNRTVDAIRRLVSRGVPVECKTPVTESNANYVEAVLNLARELGASATCDGKITTALDGEQDANMLRMSANSLQRFYFGAVKSVTQQNWGKVHEGAEVDAHLRSPCRAGTDICHITPQGEVWPCGSLPRSFGNVLERPFAELWRGSSDRDELASMKWADISECNQCPLRRYCNRCYGSAMMEDGDWRGPSLESCRHTVAIRDGLVASGQLPKESELATAYPPTWNRVHPDGLHHSGSLVEPGTKRLRILS